jgi:ubiquinone/menaquinone biosynthesis C-methylase UbiE
MASWLDDIIDQNKVSLCNQVWVSTGLSKNKSNWSFSDEWEFHRSNVGDITWDYTSKQRADQFFLEVQLNKNEIEGKVILDAGCGSGYLTRTLSELGAKVIGLDLQVNLPGDWSTDNLQFVQADFHDLPFNPACFDYIIANGSLHHTPNTEAAFKKLAPLVKNNGKFYLWLYKHQTNFRKRILWNFFDVSRLVISRLPVRIERLCVNLYTEIFYLISKIRKGRNTNRGKNELRVNLYDTLTPRYRNYHSPEEVARWFHESSFEPPVITHWDNDYGFGLVGTKRINVPKAPGENF